MESAWNPHATSPCGWGVDVRCRAADATHNTNNSRDTIVSAFTTEELDFLRSETPRLGRVATADTDAHPQVTPVGMWRYNPDTDTIDITGRNFATTRKYRNVAANPSAAFVVDDIASTDPWRPRAVIVQGPAHAITKPDSLIRITPTKVISWGLSDQQTDPH